MVFPILFFIFAHDVASVSSLWCPVLLDRTWWQVLVVIIDVIQGCEFRTEGKRKGDMDMAMIARRSSEGWGNFGKTVSQKGEDGEYLQGFLNRFRIVFNSLNTIWTQRSFVIHNFSHCWIQMLPLTWLKYQAGQQDWWQRSLGPQVVGIALKASTTGTAHLYVCFLSPFELWLDFIFLFLFLVVLRLLLSSCRCRHCRHCCHCDVVVLRGNFLFWKWPVGPHPFNYPADKLPMHLSVRSTTTFRTFSELPRHSTTFKSIMQTLCYIFVMLVEAGPGDLLWPENSLGILKGWWSIIPLRRLRLFSWGRVWGWVEFMLKFKIHKGIVRSLWCCLLGRSLDPETEWKILVVKYPGIF